MLPLFFTAADLRHSGADNFASGLTLNPKRAGRIRLSSWSRRQAYLSFRSRRTGLGGFRMSCLGLSRGPTKK